MWRSRTARWRAARRCWTLIDKVKASKGAVHLMGLMSPGGVHSHQDHIAALVKIFAAAAVPVFVHAFLDGRDTPPKSARGFIEKFLGDIDGLRRRASRHPVGRYYAMDRDKRWDRVEKCLCRAGGCATARRFDDAFAALDDSYGDECHRRIPGALRAGRLCRDCRMATPCCSPISAPTGRGRFPPPCSIRVSTGFKRARVVTFAAAAGLTEYSDALKPLMAAIFPPEDVRETLGEVIAEHHMNQLRIAETEKYAHVTFFLNGGREDQFAGEDRILVPSPKVATYDHKPEMSAYQVTDKLEEAIGVGQI